MSLQLAKPLIVAQYDLHIDWRTPWGTDRHSTEKVEPHHGF